MQVGFFNGDIDMLDGAIKSFGVGIRRRWKTGIAQAFSIAGAIWLVTEIVTKVSTSADDWIKTQSAYYSVFVAVACILWFIAYTYETRSVSFVLPTTDTRIDVRYGDLFAQRTDWLIGVGEFFDSDVGHVVSKDSLHGKLINNVYNGDTTRFRSLVELALASFKSTATNRSIHPNLKYRIGTTAVLANGPQKVFLVAMAHVDLETAKASSNVPVLWEALRGAFMSVHNFGNGAPLSLPLIGNGQSSVNIAPQHLLRLIVLALVDFGRKVGLPKQVNIVVPEACFEMLDIREIKRDWRRQ
jgi:Domain of unknown function (DUF6430)